MATFIFQTERVVMTNTEVPFHITIDTFILARMHPADAIDVSGDCCMDIHRRTVYIQSGVQIEGTQSNQVVCRLLATT